MFLKAKNSQKNILLFCLLFSCSSPDKMPPIHYYNQQQYYQPRPQYYYPQRQYYPQTNISNSRYYQNPYNEGYRDSDHYYAPPTYYNSWKAEDDDERARERSVGAADDKQ